MTISAGDVAPVSLRPIKRRVSQLDQTNRIVRVIGKTSNANAHCQLKTLRCRSRTLARRREDGLFDAASDALGSHEALQIIGIEQKRGKLFAAETCCHVAG